MDKHILLHSPLQVKNLENQDEVLFINGNENGKFQVAFLDAHFQDLPRRGNVTVSNFSNFLDLPDCQNIKAVIFILADDDNKSCIVDLEIRQMVYEEVTKRKWHIHLIHTKTYSLMLMLFASKIDSKPGDVILNVLCMGPKIIVSELHRKQEGYSYIYNRYINSFNRNVNDVATECLGMCAPKYVIVGGCNDLFISLKSRFVPSKNVINLVTVNAALRTSQALKSILVNGYNQVIPFSMDIFAVTNESNFSEPEQAVIIVDDCEDLPLERVQIVSKSKMPYYIAYLDTISKICKLAFKTQISKEQEGHRIKLALVVDRNCLPFLYQEPFIIPEIETLPQKLAANADLDVHVIGFFDNSSVICVHGENGYMFLKEWNGLYGNDLYLSFEQEKPIMITDLNNVKNNDSFVVYDLIKILSMPPNVLKVNPNWGFKVTSDSKHPVLLEYDTFLGIRKVATPVFLMALLLKHHIKAIKKKTGKKPKELGFCLFNQFTKKEKKRIKTGLDEASKLLKIDFVFISNV